MLRRISRTDRCFFWFVQNNGPFFCPLLRSFPSEQCPVSSLFRSAGSFPVPSPGQIPSGRSPRFRPGPALRSGFLAQLRLCPLGRPRPQATSPLHSPCPFPGGPHPLPHFQAHPCVDPLAGPCPLSHPLPHLPAGPRVDPLAPSPAPSPCLPRVDPQGPVSWLVPMWTPWAPSPALSPGPSRVDPLGCTLSPAPSPGSSPCGPPGWAPSPALSPGSSPYGPPDPIPCPVSQLVPV